MFVLAHGMWQFIITPLIQPKARTGRYIRPGAASDVRCPRCRRKESGVHSERCPDHGVYIDVLLCPNCGYTALLMAEYKNHVLQCYEVMSNRHLSRRRIQRRDAWTARNNIPMLFWCGRPSSRFRSHIKALAWAHKILCYLQTMHFAPENVPYPMLPERSETHISNEDVWNFAPEFRQTLRGILTVLMFCRNIALEKLYFKFTSGNCLKYHGNWIERTSTSI